MMLVACTAVHLALWLASMALVRGYTSAELSAMPRGGGGCTAGDPFHCFGNGNCRPHANQCDCYAGWTGSQCTTLDLGPAPPDGAVRRSGWSTWGGSPIRAADGRIHLFLSQMANQCSLGTWQNNSLVVHAISDNITGPYTINEDELVLPPFHHNPSVQRAPDGTYLIYCIGAMAGSCPDGPSSNCTGETIKHCDQPDAPPSAELAAIRHARERVGSASGGLDGVVHLAHSTSLSGPWTVVPKPVLAGRPGRWDEQSTNPAPHVLPNGTALLVYRGLNGLGTDRIGAAQAARGWQGQYERVVDLPLFGQCGNWTPSR